MAAAVLTGCQSPQYSDLEKAQAAAAGMDKDRVVKSESMLLHEGDTIRVSFPGAPSLDTIQVIRRDGMVSLKLVGEYKAAGVTPTEMEKELIKLYGPQLQTKEVTVSVESSAFPVYVTGAVLRPGKIMSDRPLTALEAIMEAGGFDYTKANLKAVRIIRNESGHTDHFTLNMKRALSGEETKQFNLKPADIVYVPERFAWF
jgi:polysaccharide export outer membrane protein